MDYLEKKAAFCHELPYEPSRPVFESASGIRLRDARGRTFIDALSGVFVVSFGYDCAPILEAVHRQLTTLPFSPPLHGLNRTAIELAESLTALAGPPFDCTKLVNGGSEAIEAALRITRLYHRANGHPLKTKVLSHYDGYHGATYGAMSATHRPDLNVYGPRLPGFLGIFPPATELLPYGADPARCTEICTAMIERLIQAEGPDTVGALLVEPITHLIGMFAPPREYFASLRKICDRYGIVLIFDEIVTGFGRTGNSFAMNGMGVKPDLLCMGKSVSGGYAPLAAVVMSSQVSRVLRDASTNIASLAPSHTYAGNPVSAAAGLAAVGLLNANGCIEQIRATGRYIESRLKSTLPEQGMMRGEGMLWGVKFAPPSGVSKSDFAAARLGHRIMKACLERGVIVRGEADWIALAPAFIANHADIDAILEPIQEFVQTYYRTGELP